MNKEKFQKWVTENSHQMDRETLFLECAKQLRIDQTELDQELGQYYGSGGNYVSELVPEYVLAYWIGAV